MSNIVPAITALAPDFTASALMPNKEFQDITLSSYRGKWVVFFWYPLDFTFVCPTEILAFGDRQPEFDKINTQVIAASCDSLFTHLAWVNTPRASGGLGDMKIPIVADFDKKVANSYGVLMADGIPLRGLFIIDHKGCLRQITINDLPVGRNVDEIIRLIKAFQFVELHGEVCPANWQPGDATMKPDPKGSQSYFNATHGGGGGGAGASTGASSGGAGAGELVEVENITAFNAVLKSNSLVVVDYWAPWCKNCSKISPLLARLASQRTDIKFIKVNVTVAEDVATANNIDALPYLQFYKNGASVNNFKGSDSKAIEAAISSFN